MKVLQKSRTIVKRISPSVYCSQHDVLLFGLSCTLRPTGATCQPCTFKLVTSSLSLTDSGCRRRVRHYTGGNTILVWIKPIGFCEEAEIWLSFFGRVWRVFFGVVRPRQRSRRRYRSFTWLGRLQVLANKASRWPTSTWTCRSFLPPPPSTPVNVPALSHLSSPTSPWILCRRV